MISRASLFVLLGFPALALACPTTAPAARPVGLQPGFHSCSSAIVVPGPLSVVLPMLAGGDKPELLVVGRVIDRSCRLGPRGGADAAQMPSPADIGGWRSAAGAVGLGRALRGASAWSRPASSGYVFLGVEAVALYSYLRWRRADDGASAGGAAGGAGAPEGGVAMAAREQRPATLESLDFDGDEGGDLGGVFAEGRGAVSDWRGAAVSSPTAGAEEAAREGVPASGARPLRLRFIRRVADQVAGVMDAFRGLQLTSFPVSEDTRLRIDARTGRRGHLFVILTRRF